MSDFDDLFKSRFEDHEVEVPKDMWNRIQEAQAPDDVKKPLFIFWKIGVAVLFLVSIGILTYSTKTTETISEPVVSDLLTKISPTTKEDLSCLLVASEENKVSTTEQSVDKIIGVESIAYVKSNVVSPVIQTNVVSPVAPANENTINFENLSKVTFENIVLHEIRNDNTATDIITNENKSDILGTLTKTYRDEVIEATLSSIILNTSFPIKDKLDTHFSFPEYDKKCPKFGNSVHGYFSVEGYHSTDYNLRKFEAKSEESIDYLNAREQSEYRQYSYSNGVKLKWHNNSGLGIGMGVERSVIREVFEFVNVNSREVKVLISIDTLFDASGGYTTSTDTTRIELAGVTRNVINNSYTSVDIPFNLTYQIEFNRWAIGLNAGIHLNLLFSQKGRILGFDRQPAWISSGVENELDIYQAKSGLKFDGSISIVYHLTPNLDIVAEPYFKYNRNTFTRDNSPLNQYYNTMGIRTGVRYNFGF